MTLIILLMLLIAERVVLQSPTWQVPRYFDYYILKANRYMKWDRQDSLSLFIIIALPAIVSAVLLYFWDSQFIHFVISLVVLCVCVGNEKVRYYYRQYLNASERGDKEAQELLHAKIAMFIKADNDDVSEVDDSTSARVELENQQKKLPPMSDLLIWSNFKYYAAPIFYFVLFGIPGTVFYVTLLYLVETIKLNKRPELSQYLLSSLPLLEKWQSWLDWLPARFVSTGFMFVGKFSDGLEVWIKQAANFSISAQHLICDVASAAELNENKTELEQAQSIVKLAKRNMILFLVAVALLTLYGLIV